MNIVYLIPSLENTGGMERILTEKVNYLANQKKFNIHVITTEQNTTDYGFDVSDKVIVEHFKINFYKLYNEQLIKKYFKTQKKLAIYKNRLHTYINDNNIDICVSLGGKEIEFLGNVKWNCRRIIEIHFSKNIRKQFLLARKTGWLWNLIGNYRNKQLELQIKGFDKLVVLTKGDLLEWQQITNNVKQIYNFSPFKSNLKSPLDKKRIISVGRLEPQKGFDLLIEAFSNINRDDLNGYSFHIYGDGEDKKALLELIIDKQLNNFIFLEGVSKNIQEEMYNSSIYIMTSRYEGFPMVLLEALSVGLPIISYDCPTGPAEIIENNDVGFLVEFNNAKQLVEKTVELVNNEKVRLEKGQFAYNKNKKFDKVAIMKEWIDLFNETLSKN